MNLSVPCVYLIIVYHALYVCDIIIVQQHVRDMIQAVFLSNAHSWFLVLKGLVYMQFQLFELRASTDTICALYMHSVQLRYWDNLECSRVNVV